MNNSWLGIGLLAISLSGCAGMNNTERGALGGGVVGGVAGTVIGAAVGDPLAGAAIGAGTGALIGGAAGHAEDRQEKRDAAAAAAYARQNPPMTINDVVQMSQSQVAPAHIIQQMDSTGSWFNLTPQDVIYLQQQGVHGSVISAMQARRTPPPLGLRHRREVVIVDPYPPPPVSVGIGLGWHSHRRCW